MMKTAMNYLSEIYTATCNNHKNLRDFYEGKEGALRLAREIGHGLNDFPQCQHQNAITSSYSMICVRFYDLKPPVNAKEWNTEIFKATKKQGDRQTA